MAVRGFKSTALKQFSEKNDGRKLPRKYLNRIEDILSALNGSNPISALAGYRLHPLKGDRKGQWSVRVSGNWRITFRLENGNAYDVDLEDYHWKGVKR